MGKHKMRLSHNLKIFYKKNCLPEYLIYFVTNRCNCKCKFCFFWDNINKEKNELSLEEVKKVSKSLDKFLLLALSGGEPCLREDLPDIIETFYKNNKIEAVLLPTNGLATKKIVETVHKTLDRCKHLKLLVNMSIDDIGEAHDKLRGVKGLFKKIRETHDELQDLKKKFSTLDVSCVIVFSNFNQHKIFEIYDYIKRNFNFDSISSALVRGDVKNPNIKDVNIDIYDEFTKLIEKDVTSRKIKGHHNFSMSDFTTAANIILRKKIVETVRKNRCITQCYAGYLNGVMYSNGDVYACEILDKKIGNVRDYNYDFKKLWMSKQADKVRNLIKNTNCFCTHECNWTTNVLFNPRYIASLIKTVIQLRINSFKNKL